MSPPSGHPPTDALLFPSSATSRPLTDDDPALDSPLPHLPVSGDTARAPLPPDAVDSLLNRPADQRKREFQYRFAQSAIFGLPVFALQLFGRSLGGAEADRWVSILQALLAGWVVYVAAAGMLFESIVWLGRRKLTIDLIPAAAAVSLYGLSLVRTLYGIWLPSRSFPVLFHWEVLVLLAWTGSRWWWLASKPTLEARKKPGR